MFILVEQRGGKSKHFEDDLIELLEYQKPIHERYATPERPFIEACYCSTSLIRELSN
jgi:hypothetical protein